MRARWRRRRWTGPTGGIIREGFYRLIRSEVYLTTAEVPPVTLDIENMYSDIAGVLFLGEDGIFALDMVGSAHAVTTSGLMTDRDILVSFSGPVTQPEMGATTFSVDIVCPEAGRTVIRHSVLDERVMIQLDFTDPVAGTIVATFERQP